MNESARLVPCRSNRNSQCMGEPLASPADNNRINNPQLDLASSLQHKVSQGEIQHIFFRSVIRFRPHLPANEGCESCAERRGLFAMASSFVGGDMRYIFTTSCRPYLRRLVPGAYAYTCVYIFSTCCVQQGSLTSTTLSLFFP